MSDRDDLAALINGAPIPQGAVIGTKRERKAYRKADAILATGWRAPGTTFDGCALAALIRSTIRARSVADDAPIGAAYICDDDPIDDVTIDGQVDLRGVADAILAAYDVTAKREIHDGVDYTVDRCLVHEFGEIRRWSDGTGSRQCQRCGTLMHLPVESA